MREAEAALRLANVQRDRLRQVLAGGAISQNLFEEKEQAVKVAEAKLEQTKAAAKKLFEEKEQAVTVAVAKLNRARTALDPSSAIVRIAQERIAQEEAKGEVTLAALKKEREFLIQRRVEVQSQASHAQKELQQAESKLQKSVIRATSDGTILKLNLRNPEQVVHSGEVIAQIAPSNAPLVVKAMIATQDIDRVAVGQKVQLRLLACPYPDYGTLEGAVIAISPDAVTSQVTQGNSASTTTVGKSVQNLAANAVASYFEATIQPKSFSLMSGNQQCRIQAGMDAKADIISREETVLQYILRRARLLTQL